MKYFLETQLLKLLKISSDAYLTGPVNGDSK